MGALDDTLNNDNLARLLIYGPAKTRKTWFATKAAELGFNVILIDTDYGFHVTQNLTPEARRRIYHLDRGYEHIEHKLNAVGARIRREKQ